MLAKTIETSADGRTCTFTLREGVTFHDGAPLTSREVVWTWERFLDPKSGWPRPGRALELSCLTFAVAISTIRPPLHRLTSGDDPNPNVWEGRSPNIVA
ncbi:ABC transporter substrate-binding protein [Bradyrhizobium commune]|uniref:ABC transporter substrate-binding protein n=1 Tax=Bradyrhizobium commune TaxID=83627 RepID=UPI001FEE4633|nr:ABC transporter substrate-binding protein [Bradyrhizobium commune]